MTDLFTPLSETEFDELDHFLLHLESEDSALDLSELDGFFTAIVSGPDIIPPSEWLEVVWGGGEQAPVWKSEEQCERIIALMMRHMNTIASILMEMPEDFQALFLEREVEGKIYTIVDEWCHGFMKGVALRSSYWDEMPSAIEDFLAPMLMFSTEAGYLELEKMSEEEVDFWQRQIEPAVRRIHGYWLTQRSNETPDWDTLEPMGPARNEPFCHDQPRVGRNDPCPCGSGKKFKKCCMH